MDAMFQEAHKGPHGDTLYSENPKIAAYRYAAQLKMCGITYQITFQADGSITVTGTALAPTTYELEANNEH